MGYLRWFWPRNGKRRSAKEKQREAAERYQRYWRLLAQEQIMALRRYFGSTGIGFSALPESDRAAWRRIYKDVRLAELPKEFRELAADYVLGFCRASVEWVRSKLMMFRHSFALNLAVLEENLTLREEIAQRLAPLAEGRSLTQPSAQTESLLEIPTIAISELKENAQYVAELAKLKKQLWQLTIQKLWLGAKAFFYAMVDGVLTYLAMMACFSGTSGFVVLFPFCLTAAIIIALVGAAHLLSSAKSQRKWGWTALIGGIIVLGSLRASAGLESGGYTSVSAIMLILLNIFPLFVLAYYASRAILRMRALDPKIASLQNSVGQLLARRALSIEETRELERANAQRGEAVRRQERLLRNIRMANETEERHALERELRRCDAEIRQVERWINEQISSLINRVRGELKDLHEDTAAIMVALWQESLMEGGDTNEHLLQVYCSSNRSNNMPDTFWLHQHDRLPYYPR